MPDSIQQLILDYLHQTRETQSEFARRTGISPALISKLASGTRTTVGRSTVPKLAEGLKVSSERIMATVRQQRPTRREVTEPRPGGRLAIPTWRSCLTPRPVPLVGREPDRRRLSQWMGETTAPCMVMISEPGAGKTTIANAWLEEDVLQHQMASSDEPPPIGFPLDTAARPQRIFHWTHTRENGDFDAAITAATEFLDAPGGGGEDSLSRRIDQLVRRLDTDRMLMIFDDVDLLDPARDRAVTQFFSQLPALSSGSKVLLLASCSPACMCHCTGQLVSGCAEVILGPLDDDDAVRMLRQLGINDTAERLTVLAEQAGGNPLLLMEVASRCKRGPIPMPVPGDLRNVQDHLHTVLSGLFEHNDCDLDDNVLALAGHLTTAEDTMASTSLDGLCTDSDLLDLMTRPDDRQRQVLEAANALAVAGLATFDPAAHSLTLAAAFQRWIQYEYAAAGGDATS